MLRFHGFGLLGTQEGYKNPLDETAAALPQSSDCGVGRDDGKEKGEHSTIFHKNAEFSLLNKGDFRLSQTQDKPGLGWGATCCNRICSWVYSQNKKIGKTLYVFNLHYDHQGVVARKESSKLILQKIKTIAGDQPVLYTGDFNGSEKSEWYQTVAGSGMLNDTRYNVYYPYANKGSFNGFGKPKDSTDVIDHILVPNILRPANGV